ncbi:SDR family oxidoreductase [Ulvibacterium marinum]|uniref:SDR family oxidoreductase n=1 Tax=Ulvibacterium marinum TaxID=2419782 RepID=UPI00249546AC|nr:SDR family oxidoreductase [Ulvibacterium marinum]
MSKSIAIMGCGWLGLPLAKSFVDEGYSVHGSTTSEEKLPVLEKEGIQPFLISLSEEGPKGPVLHFLKDVDSIIINVPPKLRGGNRENYIEKIRGLYNAVKASSVQKIVFVSSTSVYGDIDGEVTEDTLPKPHTESGRQLLTTEDIFRNDNQLYTTVVRFGGLIGPKRHPVTMLSGRTGLANGAAPINLIHLDDCIAILKKIVVQGWWNEVFNAVYPDHPPKAEYYSMEARKRGIPVPDYSEDSVQKGKKVMSSSLILVKKYRFNTSIYN